ncbi:MAG: hypothetical protein ABJB66_03260 [Gemmatimonadaceae bacterium]
MRTRIPSGPLRTQYVESPAASKNSATGGLGAGLTGFSQPSVTNAAINTNRLAGVVFKFRFA